MSDYIKRDDAIKSLCKMCLVGEYKDGVCRYMSNGECAEIEDIKDIPPADVIEPKRGEWIPCTKSGLALTELMRREGQKWYGYKCSNCNDIYKGNALKECNFCRNCGCAMTKE